MTLFIKLLIIKNSGRIFHSQRSWPINFYRELKSVLKRPTSEKPYLTKIQELKPQIIADSRSIDVIADIVDELSWQAGASVKGTIIFEKKESISVPEQSVVLRPSGTVVYEAVDGKAIARTITTGIFSKWMDRNH